MKPLYTVLETAEMLGYAKQTVYNKIYNTKEIEAVRLPSGAVRVRKEEIERILNDVEVI